ncbi:hypothetical protein DXG01_012176 [Tephrocybe rancida]|nr:hypothetical protein DXG01_012176 [Tephrocybe rancida]
MASITTKRDFFLIVYRNRLFAAHWSIWIPNAVQLEGEDLGKVIHVTGNPVTGFVHEVKRGYDMSATRRDHVFVLLGKINSDLIIDQREEAIITAGVDLPIEPIDMIEKLALSVPAPKKTLKSIDDEHSGPKPKIENCQKWIGYFVDLLVDETILDGDARSLVEGAPKH